MAEKANSTTRGQKSKHTAKGFAQGGATKVKGHVTGFTDFIRTQGGIGLAVGHAIGTGADFAWGAALSSFITLVATALVIYWLVHVFKLDKLDKKKD